MVFLRCRICREFSAECDDLKFSSEKRGSYHTVLRTVTCRTIIVVRKEYTAAVTGDKELPSDSGTSNNGFFS